MVRDFFKMENDLVSQLVSSRKDLINRLKEWRPEGSTDPAIELIFYKVSSNGLKGKTIKELISSLSNGEKVESQEYYYDKFRKEGDSVIKHMIATRDKLLD